MGQIFKPNFTYDASEGWLTRFQYHWSEHTTSCGRPPADFNVPIACYTQGGSDAGPSWPGGTFGAAADLYEQCCPSHVGTSGASEGELTTAYRADYSCRTVWCYTASEALARGYGACVDRVARHRIAELGDGAARNASGEVFGARCEWVDYTSLRKGVVKQSGSGAAGADSGRRVLAAVLAGLAVVVVTGGLA